MTYGTPPTNHHLARERDRAVRRAGRLRAALVGGATAASVAVAGVLGFTAVSAGTTSSAAPQAPSGTSSQGSSSAGTSSKPNLIQQLKSFGSGQPVSNGNGGPTVATTKGS
jgi:hypothetical protein